MIKIQGKLPQSCYVAVSGGADSMAILHFLTKDNKRDVTVLHFNHGTEFSTIGQSTVAEYCDQNDINFHVGYISGDKPKDMSSEEYWRDERYKFFLNFTDKPILLAHNLDDVVETYIFSVLHGNPKLIPHFREPNIVRPFMLTKKETLQRWCEKNDVPWVDDPSNEDVRYMRALIRKNVTPVLEQVNPGFSKIVKRKLEEEFDRYKTIPLIKE